MSGGTLDPAVRVAGAHDVSSLLALIDEVQVLHVRHRADMFKPLELSEVQARVEALVADPLVTIWIAELNGVACGYLVAIVRNQAANAFALARTFLELDQLGVKHGFRRLGIARALIAESLTHAGALGIAAVELSSWSFNHEAHRAFERLGFVPKVVRFERKSE